MLTDKTILKGDYTIYMCCLVWNNCKLIQLAAVYNNNNICITIGVPVEFGREAAFC